MSEKIQFLAELIEIIRQFRNRNNDIKIVVGAESVSFLESEIARLWQVVLDLSGVTIKKNEYHDALVANRAANIAWPCFQEIELKMADRRISTETLAEWFLDYAAGDVFGEPHLFLKNWKSDECSQGDLAKEFGLLPPRRKAKRGRKK